MEVSLQQGLASPFRDNTCATDIHCRLLCSDMCAQVLYQIRIKLSLISFKQAQNNSVLYSVEFPIMKLATIAATMKLATS